MHKLFKQTQKKLGKQPPQVEVCSLSCRRKRIKWSATASAATPSIGTSRSSTANTRLQGTLCLLQSPEFIANRQRFPHSSYMWSCGRCTYTSLRTSLCLLIRLDLGPYRCNLGEIKNVQRVASIPHKDKTCTKHIPEIYNKYPYNIQTPNQDIYPKVSKIYKI